MPVNPAMIKTLPDGTRKTWAADLVAGARFRVEVAVKDAEGFHRGYGPGPTVFTATDACRASKPGTDRVHVFSGPTPVYLED